MGKHGKRFYLQLSREIFTDKHKGLSTNAKWLYVVLNELEHRFANDTGDGSFFQSDKDLSTVSGIKMTALKAAKKELIESGLIETWQGHFDNDGKKSQKHITYYRIPTDTEK